MWCASRAASWSLAGSGRPSCRDGRQADERIPILDGIDTHPAVIQAVRAVTGDSADWRHEAEQLKASLLKLALGMAIDQCGFTPHARKSRAPHQPTQEAAE